ncbi:nuclear transport factor 2 family protein [Fodinicola acaciae]|uniref:nuclear transport factor 2 family protein n=1 Tax=Fodinicola acaciae TaxID=2681555 RepID=UPI0013D7C292|nr:nuclear transport factor 2 family protein [Fodinicola acaciae]
MTATVTDTIELVQIRLNQALVDGDSAALRELVADDCRIIGPKGFMVATDEWIDVHASGVYEQVRLETVESEVIDHGDTAIRSDMQRSACVFQGERIGGLYRVLSVWLRTTSGWQLAATQYTAISPAAGG